MGLKEMLKPKLSNIIAIVVLLVVVFYYTNVLSFMVDGPNYFKLPFNIKQTSCGGLLPVGVVSSCSYPWVFSGIIYSIIFWAIAYFLVSFAFYKIKNK